MNTNYLKLILVFFTLITSCSQKEILSSEEKEWLVKNPNIKVSVYGYVPPYLFNNDNGISYGVFIDYLDLIESKIDYKFQKIEYDSWPKLYNDALKGNIDVILDIPKTTEREKHFDFYGSFFESKYVVVCRNNQEVTFQDLAKAKIIVPESYAIVETLKKRFPKAIIETLPKEQNCLKALSKGNYDAYLGPKLVANYFIHQLNITNLKISEVTPFSYEPKISVVKSNPKLSKIISKAVQNISIDEKNVILNNWLYNEIKPFYRRLDFWLIIIIALIVTLTTIVTINRVLKKIIRRRTLLLQEAINKATINREVKNRFIQNISHEIRTPMNGILGFSELLGKEGISKKEQLNYIKHINSAGKRLIHIIDSILDISSFGATEIEACYQEVNLNLLLKGTEIIYKEIADLKGVELHFHTDLKPSELLLIDKNATLKIYENLIDNAIKFTCKGSVYVVTRFDNEQLLIEISDTGKGIDKKDKEAIFEMFSLNDLKAPVLNDGLGIGLTIVREYVKTLKGEITFESEVMKGSTFKIKLPAKKIKAQSEGTITSNKNKDFTILVVEDAKVNFLLVKSILKQLKDYNLTILHAENGQLGVQMCDNYPEIDLIIMDIRMPVMNGYDATRIIKAKYPNYKVIAHTAYSSDVDVKKALDVGCEAVLAKPVEMVLFKETIINYLKNARN